MGPASMDVSRLGESKSMIDDSPKLNVLLYCERPLEAANAATIIDHVDAFGNYSRHRIRLWSTRSGLPSEEELKQFDCIVVHYSMSLLYDAYVSQESLERLRNFPGLKLLFLQDEYRRVNFTCDKIKYAKIDALFTCAPKGGVAEKIYAGLNGEVSLITTLTGYVPEALANVETKPIAERSIDVGYRARKCPFWYGRKSHEKYLIGKQFVERTKGAGLKNDVSSSEKDRIYGDKWVEFLADCKATLGTESGASLIDFTGEVEYSLNRWQAFHPFREFEDVPPRLLKQDGEIELQVISPRCFEAAALGTVMILYPGEYSGALVADEHYLRLEKDFSNVDEIVRRLSDHEDLERVAANARRDLVESGDYSYRNFIREFDEAVDELVLRKQWKPVGGEVTLSDRSDATDASSPGGSSSLKGRLLNYKRRLWKNLPHWLKFFLGVTLLKRKYYCHFNAEENSYLKEAL